MGATTSITIVHLFEALLPSPSKILYISHIQSEANQIIFNFKIVDVCSKQLKNKFMKYSKTIS